MMVKQLTHEGEDFYPLTSTKSCVDENGNSVDELYKKLLDLVTPQILEFQYIDGIFVAESEPDNAWINSLSKGIKFDFEDKNYVLYPISCVEVDGVKSWKFSFENSEFSVDSNKNIIQ